VAALAVRTAWRRVWVRRAAGLTLVFGVALVAIHLVDVGPGAVPAAQWRGHIRLGLQGQGGGLLGGAAASLLTDAFGVAGTLVLLAAALLVAAILLFDVSLAELAGAVARGTWRLASGAAWRVWQAAHMGAAEAVTGARRAWERRQLRGLRERDARRWDEPTAGRPVVEGESFARPFTRRNRASSAASEEDTATLMPEGGTPRAAEVAGAGADWRGGDRAARHPLPAALDASGAASDGNGNGE